MILIILGLLLGSLLAIMGYPITTWQFWAVVGLGGALYGCGLLRGERQRKR